MNLKTGGYDFAVVLAYKRTIILPMSWNKTCTKTRCILDCNCRVLMLRWVLFSSILWNRDIYQSMKNQTVN